MNQPKPIEMLQNEHLLEVDKLVREFGKEWEFPADFEQEDVNKEYGEWCTAKFSKGYIAAYREFEFKHESIKKVAYHQMMADSLQKYADLWSSIMRNHAIDTYLF